MRRTLVLAGLVAVGLALVLAIEAPRRRTGEELARGPRIFRTSPHGIRRIEAALGERRFVAERTHDGWKLDAFPAAARAQEALDSLATELATLRAIDAFRVAAPAAYGLEPANGAIVVTTRRNVQRLTLGTLNSAGSAFYARRDEHARVLQVGVYLLSTIQRVLDEGAIRNQAAHARTSFLVRTRLPRQLRWRAPRSRVPPMPHARPTPDQHVVSVGAYCPEIG
jgi:hypothetical protein